jgi:hypothetical protein
MVAMLLGSAAYARDIAGQWQGTIKSGSKDLRVIVRISKSDAGGWTGTVYRIDEFTIAFPVNAATLENATLKFSAPRNSYEGTLSPDGTVLNGILTDGRPFSLAIRRAAASNGTNAWHVPVSSSLRD